MPQYQEEAYDANEKLLSFIRILAEEKKGTSAQSKRMKEIADHFEYNT